MNLTPNIKEFKKKAKKGCLVPVYAEIFADLETPVSAFKKLESPYSFLLESVEGGERIARYSFIGFNPEKIFKSRDNKVEVIRNGKSNKFISTKDALFELKKEIGKFKLAKTAGLPPFTGGAVGFISYDMVRYFEKLPDKNTDEINSPDIYMLITNTLVIFDHVKHTIKIVSNVSSDGSLTANYKNAAKKISSVIVKLKKPLKTDAKVIEAAGGNISELKSNMTKKEYCKNVLKAKEYIKAGDIIQMVPSQRLSADIKDVDALNLYRTLRIINPSPYMYYLKFKDFKIVGASPELFVKVEEGTVTSRPIAGTRKRGTNPAEDEKLVKELLKDEKEKAEHVMLVDLARNDLGRVCKYHTVNVNEFMIIEKYSHVLHLVSNVVGKLQKDKDAFDVIRACFPAGTLSGAPKIRAMEIIDEVEKVRRGPYGGLVGYFGYSGNFDSCITIRTLVIANNRLHVQAGAGIVADSNPASEYEESMNKAKAVISAINLARRGL
ncbi:MAG: anthranilate synthase component I [Candidatus Firestonebacteria bacterium]